MSLATDQTLKPSAVLVRLAAVVLVAAVLLGAMVLSLYLQDRRHQVASAEQQAQDLVERQQQFFAQELDAVRSDLLYLAQQHALQELLAGDEEVRPKLEHEYVQFALYKAIYDQIRSLDTTGREIIRVNYNNGHPQIVPLDELQDKTSRYYFQRALLLDPGEVFITPLDLNVEHNEIERPLKPVVRFLTPVVGASGQIEGLLVLNYLGEHILGTSSEIAKPGPGAMLLVNSRGEYLRGLVPEDEWGWMLGHDRNFPASYPAAWEKIKSADSAQFLLDDGLYTFQRIRPVEHLPEGVELPEPDEAAPPDSDLILISRVPRSELYAPADKLLTQLLFLYGGAMLLVLVIAGYWARGAAIRKIQRERLAASEKRLRLLSAQLLAAQEDERRRISRELHDGMGQLLTAVRLDLKSAAAHDIPDKTRDLLQRGVEETDQLLANVHDIAGRLRPSVLDDLGLGDAVESYLESFQQRTGIEVTSDLILNGRPVPRVAGENIYRILQEALTNVARHSQTEKVWVELSAAGDQLTLDVRDEGVGFAPAQLDGSRLGILGMQERAELLGGKVHIESTPGKGAHLHVSIPLSDDQE